MFRATIGKVATFIDASPEFPKEVLNAAGGVLFHKNAADVDSGDTELASGAVIRLTEGTWFVSTTSAEAVVRELETGRFDGGITSPSALPGAYTGGWHPNTAESGTDATPAEKKLFVASLFLPVSKTIKGIGFLVGSVGGTNKVVAGLFDSAGKLLAHSSETTEGTLVGTAKEIQELNLTAAFNATGPGLYFVGITMNGNTARLRTIPKNTIGSNVLSGELTLAAKNVLADIVAPTALAADKGPVAWVF